MKLGALHRAPPAAIRPLGQRAALHRMTPPASVDWAKLCPPDGDALGNDHIGDCVPCAMLRAIEVRRANAWRDAWCPDATDAVALYAQLAGYDPVTGAGDTGTDTAHAMTVWAQAGIQAGAVQDVALWATVNPQDAEHLAIACAHLGPVQITLALPYAAQDTASWAEPPGTGAGWEPGSWGAHRVLLVAYDGDVRTVRTWGQDVAIHPAWWAAYAIAADATLERTWLDTTGLAPAGLDWDALVADLARVAA